MDDLTKITKPYGMLDAQTQEALSKYRGPIEVFSSNSKWEELGKVTEWWPSLTYRAKPESA